MRVCAFVCVCVCVCVCVFVCVCPPKTHPYLTGPSEQHILLGVGIPKCLGLWLRRRYALDRCHFFPREEFFRLTLRKPEPSSFLIQIKLAQVLDIVSTGHSRK